MISSMFGIHLRNAFSIINSFVCNQYVHVGFTLYDVIIFLLHEQTSIYMYMYICTQPAMHNLSE